MQGKLMWLALGIGLARSDYTAALLAVDPEAFGGLGESGQSARRLRLAMGLGKPQVLAWLAGEGVKPLPGQNVPDAVLALLKADAERLAQGRAALEVAGAVGQDAGKFRELLRELHERLGAAGGIAGKLTRAS